MNSIRFAVLTALTVLTAFASAASAHGDGHDETAAIGKPGVAVKALRTISIDMTDAMRFTPANIEVKQNETVRFVITNSGMLKHELMLGTEKKLKEHYELMKKDPEMEHDDPNQVSLAPGTKGEIVWQFTKAGRVAFACLQPGHYDAGMKGAVNVVKASDKPAHK